MEQVGIRELRDHASEILRQVREERTQYVITYQGRPTALLLPIDLEALEEHLTNEGQAALGENTLTDQIYGLVKAVYSDEELDELYADH